MAVFLTLLQVLAVIIVSVTALLFVLKTWMQGPKFRPKSPISLAGKVVVITGANTGIGKVCAYEMAHRGGKVIMLCRNYIRGQLAAEEIRSKTSNGEMLVVECDLSSLSSVRLCVATLLTMVDHIDILLNNAGVCMLPYSITEDGIETTMAVNHFGHFLLTNLLMPLLQNTQILGLKSGNKCTARVVVVSSLIHDKGKLHLEDLNYQLSCYVPVQAYYDSKLANIMFAKELSKRLGNNSGVNVYALHPGVIATDLGRHFKEISSVLNFLSQLCYPLLKTPESGAQTSLYCCLEESLRCESGKYYSDCKVKQPDKIVENSQLAEQLWQVSERITGLSPQGTCTEIFQGVLDLEEGTDDLPLHFSQGALDTPLVYAQA